MIRFSQFLTEVFDNPKPFELVKKDNNSTKYRFPVSGDDRWIFVVVYPDLGGRGSELEFYRANGEGYNSTVGMTDTRDSIMVMSTVVKIYLDHFNGKLKKDQSIYFTADSDEKSRVSLYKKLASQMAKKLGGHVDVYGEAERDDTVKIYIRGAK